MPGRPWNNPMNGWKVPVTTRECDVVIPQMVAREFRVGPAQTGDRSDFSVRVTCSRSMVDTRSKKAGDADALPPEGAMGAGFTPGNTTTTAT